MSLRDYLDDDWCSKAKTRVGVTIPRQVSLGDIRVLTEHDPESDQEESQQHCSASTSCPRSLNEGLCPGSTS